MLGSLSLLGQFVLLAIFAFHVPKRLGTEWPWMGRMIFYDILLTAGSLIFSVMLRTLADGTHYSTRRPSIRIRRVRGQMRRRIDSAEREENLFLTFSLLLII